MQVKIKYGLNTIDKSAFKKEKERLAGKVSRVRKNWMKIQATIKETMKLVLASQKTQHDFKLGVFASSKATFKKQYKEITCKYVKRMTSIMDTRVVTNANPASKCLSANIITD